jgi:hypothetical protein
MRRSAAIVIVATLALLIAGGGAFWWVESPRTVPTSTPGDRPALFFYTNDSNAHARLRMSYGFQSNSFVGLYLDFDPVADPANFKWAVIGMGSLRFSYLGASKKSGINGEGFFVANEMHVDDLPHSCGGDYATTRQSLDMVNNLTDPNVAISVVTGTWDTASPVNFQYDDIEPFRAAVPGTIGLGLKFPELRTHNVTFDTTRIALGFGSAWPKEGVILQQNQLISCVPIPQPNSSDFVPMYAPTGPPAVQINFTGDDQYKIVRSNPKTTDDSNPDTTIWRADRYASGQIDVMSTSKAFEGKVIVAAVGILGGVVATLVLWLAGIGRT